MLGSRIESVLQWRCDLLQPRTADWRATKAAPGRHRLGPAPRHRLHARLQTVSHVRPYLQGCHQGVASQGACIRAVWGGARVPGPRAGGGGTESGAGGLRGDPLRPLACSDVDVGSNIDGIGMRHIGMRHIGMRYLYIKMCHVGMYAHTDSMTTPSLQPTCLPRHRAESRRNDSHRLAVRRGVMGDPGWLPPWAWEALHPLAWWLHTRTPGDVRSLCIRSINTVLLHST